MFTSNQTFLSSKKVIQETVYSRLIIGIGVVSRHWLGGGIGSSSISSLKDVSGGGVGTRIDDRRVAAGLAGFFR